MDVKESDGIVLAMHFLVNNYFDFLASRLPQAETNQL
jgi:hypothetical protein